MRTLYQRIFGFSEVAVTGAEPERMLNCLAKHRIAFWNVQKKDAFTIRVCVMKRDVPKLAPLAARVQCQVDRLKTAEGIGSVRKFFRRPVLLIMLALTIYCVLTLPNYIWTIHVEGNETIPETEILRALDELGVTVGTKIDSFRSQDIKNRLLNLVDGLQWAAVNCSGGRATVLVKERMRSETAADRRDMTGIVASRDAIISDMSVLSGYPLCKVGDTVIAGQLLVTGTMDYGTSVQETRAIAEIYAYTWYDREVLQPETCQQKITAGKTRKSVYLQIGRKRIKLFGNSRICDGKCDKMIQTNALTLPGGITFPIALLTEQETEYQTVEAAVSKSSAQTQLSAFEREQISESMIAGTIRSEKAKITKGNGVYRFQAVYTCQEMIARTMNANLLGYHEGN